MKIYLSWILIVVEWVTKFNFSWDKFLMKKIKSWFYWFDFDLFIYFYLVLKLSDAQASTQNKRAQFAWMFKMKFINRHRSVFDSFTTIPDFASQSITLLSFCAIFAARICLSLSLTSLLQNRLDFVDFVDLYFNYHFSYGKSVTYMQRRSKSWK